MQDFPDEIRLTKREQEVLLLVAQGLENKEIAVRLELSVCTITCHLRNIYEKLEVNNRTQAVYRALQL